MIGSLTNDKIATDAEAYAEFLLARPEVRGSAVGTTGYCMAGRMSMMTAIERLAGQVRASEVAEGDVRPPDADLIGASCLLQAWADVGTGLGGVTGWHICDGSRQWADRLLIRPARWARPEPATPGTGQKKGTPKRPDP